MGQTGRTGLKRHSQTGGSLVDSVDDNACHRQCAFGEGNLRENVVRAAFVWNLKKSLEKKNVVEILFLYFLLVVQSNFIGLS